MDQEDTIVPPTCMFRGSTDVNLHHTQTTAIPGPSLWVDWQLWKFMGGLGYPQGGHSSTDTRETPHWDYPSATLPTFDGDALNHPLPVTTGEIDKASARANTSIGGVAEVPYPLAAPPMTLPPSLGERLVGVDDFGYPQGGHPSTDARETPHDALTTASTSMWGYPSATLPTFDGDALNHPLPVTTGVMDKALASVSTLIGGVAAVPFPLTAPPMTPPPSAGEPPVGVGYMPNSGRAIVATGDEAPAVAGGHAQVASGEAAQPSQHQVQGAPVTRSVEVLKMEQHLLAQGVKRAIVDLCLEIFKQGFTIDALEAPMTLEESEEYGAVGKIYRQLLEMAGGGGMRIMHECRLCRRKVYKNHRDGLRHLLKSHFRIGYPCEW